MGLQLFKAAKWGVVKNLELNIPRRIFLNQASHFSPIDAGLNKKVGFGLEIEEIALQ